MSRGRHARPRTPTHRKATTQVLAALLLLSALASVAWAYRLESRRTRRLNAPVAATPPPSRSLVTPVLSLRRTPQWLVAPQAARRLAAALDPLMATVPPTTCVLVADSTGTVFSRNADAPMPAASNQKLVTALAALDTFGPNATFATTFKTLAPPKDGVVDGDLFMVGGGDPVIDTDTYQRTMHYGRTPHTSLEGIADTLVAKGIRHITGSIIGDDRYFDSQRTVASWPRRYLQQGQVGPLSALSVNDARTYPALPGGSGSPQPATDPAGYAATALTQLLVARGVGVDGAPRGGPTPEAATTVAEVRSLPVRDLIAEMLRFSDHNTAELLTKAVGRTAKGAGTTDDGVAAASEVLRRHGLDVNGTVLKDGSGLDPENRLTCSLLTGILGVGGPSGPIADGLAVADGPDGTLRDRFGGSPAAHAVRAKTGTLNNVTALSGWIRTSHGAEVRFSIIVNTGARRVQASDRDFETRVAEAIMAYPDTIALDEIAPHAPR
ncbi:MAG: D-alanyl-D-alanine carboxypeptidase/D-alanyl-D-alanine-endopeptidase [Microthrixaceae bacterium]